MSNKKNNPQEEVLATSALNPTLSTTISNSTSHMPPVHYLHELSQADEERLEKLFNTLDKDGNGRIDIHDLSDALKEAGLCHSYAEVRNFGSHVLL